jgi:hypothetical protein
MPYYRSTSHIARDGNQGDLWLFHGGAGTDFVFRLATNAVLTQVAPLGYIGMPSAMGFNGIPAGTLNVAPMNVQAAGFTLEFGVWGNPGELGVLALTKPFLHVLATGTVDSAGVLAVKMQIPQGLLSPGNPGQLEFTGASIDLSTSRVLLTKPKPWPKN